MGISKQTRSEQLDTGQVHILGSAPWAPGIEPGE